MNRAARYYTPRYQHAFPHRCLDCGARKARFQYRGRVYADRDHTLCKRCFSSLLQQVRAGRLQSQGHGSPV